MEGREERQDNARDMRNTLASQTATNNLERECTRPFIRNWRVVSIMRPNLFKLQLQTVVDLLHHLRPASGKEGKDVVADINVIGAGSVLDLQLDRVEAVEYLALEDGYAGLLFERMYLRVVAVNEFWSALTSSRIYSLSSTMRRVRLPESVPLVIPSSAAVV
ncbi:predicted protein [Pyrenophora tritici-repentis Pt-1C-BFP]|uniref:Uncharacterized protein n=1 Tax=Pyrenophora tritici-repentis (strain Pt-1C-BFP) TaxID=426418 RepID=B2WP80_PYRTR|nr:uncharacterized protein PTRG_11790 [Pyrenophora tritici-repentis Pt-1C-BFP]EDU45946.1 predicted protein [Pyrenophora tritici-repentis Pt-1C-BFP]